MSYLIRPTSECRCGSGKLYRDCCARITKLPKNASPDLRRRYWGKLVDEFVTSVLDFLDREELLEGFREEAAELLVDQIPHSVDLEMFLGPWDAYTLFHHLIDLPPDDDCDDTDGEDEEDLIHVPVAILFAMQGEKDVWSKGDRKEVVRELFESHFSWYRATEVIPGEGIRLQDLVLEEEVFVTDIAASLTVEKGWIVCTKVLRFDGVSILHGLCSIPLPAVALAAVKEISENLREQAKQEFKVEPDRSSIGMFAPMILSSYLACVADGNNSAAPELRNTDDDPMEPVTIEYGVQGISVEQVVARITHVLGEVKDGPGADVVESDKDGNPIKVVVPFIQQPAGNSIMESVLIARFIVEPQVVVVEVNSVNRATKIKRLVEEQLGDILSFVGEKVVDLAAFMAKPQAGRIDPHNMPPEVHEALKQHMRGMQERWLTQSIPALGGLTPQQAAETHAGRELLEALLDDFAIRNKQLKASGSDMECFDVEELRARLGMTALD